MFSAKCKLSVSASVLALLVSSQVVYAQSVGDTEQVVVTGSRFGARTATESSTPVDALTAADLEKSGGMELQNQLKVSVPSFSTPSPATAGALDFLQPPTLRGLGPGQLLVLINGKRYHPDAALNTGSQIGRGDIEYNFNSVPSAALAGIEVLRDGAAAQYGSDAIAGVINLRLDDRIGTDIKVRGGITTKSDGQFAEFSIGHGFDLGNGGFLRITGDYKASGSTNRALPDTRQQYFGKNALGASVAPSSFYGSGIGLTPPNGTLDTREATVNRNTFHFGQSPYHSGSLVLNGEYPVLPELTVYAFAAFNRLVGNSPQFARIAANDATVRSLHPDGFVPIDKVRLTNITGTLGARGTDLVGFNWDLSQTYGGSFDQHGLFSTNNASLGNGSPVDFPLTERVRFLQATSNLDLTRKLDLGSLGPLDIAFGAEYRDERYIHEAGQANAYVAGGSTILDGPNVGKPAPIGAQPGVPAAADAANLGRDSYAFYGEVSKTFWDVLNLDAAVRHENYTDFGAVTNFKFAGRLQLPYNFAVRSSFGSGFRAPALAQEGFTSTVSNFVGSNQVITKFVAAGSALGNLVGAPALKPEASTNASVGLVYADDDFTGSVDVYQVKLKHRIVYSSTFSSTALTNYLTTQGFAGISSVAFETNAADTTTSGVDITGSYRYRTEGWGTLVATVAANFSDTVFDRISGTPSQLTAFGITTPIVDLTNQYRIARQTPKNKETLDLNWGMDQWHVDLTNTRYGSIAQVDFASSTPAQIASFGTGYNLNLVPITGSANSQVVQKFAPDIVTDLNVSYDYSDALKLTVGASNLFDIYPEKQIASTAATVAAGTNGADNAGIFPYAYSAPYGTAGRFVYLSVGYQL